ncbi:hypothetical protein VUR80DRAFT_9903 [Thermomyces stellatus]
MRTVMKRSGARGAGDCEADGDLAALRLSDPAARCGRGPRHWLAASCHAGWCFVPRAPHQQPTRQAKCSRQCFTDGVGVHHRLHWDSGIALLVSFDHRQDSHYSYPLDPKSQVIYHSRYSYSYSYMRSPILVPRLYPFSTPTSAIPTKQNPK